MSGEGNEQLPTSGLDTADSLLIGKDLALANNRPKLSYSQFRLPFSEVSHPICSFTLPSTQHYPKRHKRHEVVARSQQGKIVLGDLLSPKQ